METRFVLPVTMATALHALVLFALHDSSNPWAKPPVRVVPRPPPVEVTFDGPADVVEVDAPDPKPTKGSPDIERPQTDEPPPRVIPDGSIIQKIQTVTRAVFDPGKLLPGVPGVADGDEGAGPGVALLDRSMLDNEPHTRSQISPYYPNELKQAGVTGEVVVEFVVDEAGRVLSPRVVRTTDAGFNEATLRAVARWRFEPGKKDGRPVRFRMAVPVVFSLGR